MIRYAGKALLARLRHGGLRILLTVIGVALGVATVLAVQILNRNALAAFEGSVEAVRGPSDLTVVGVAPTLSDSLLPAVLAVAGVAAAWPVYRVQAALADSVALQLDVLGVDLTAPRDWPWGGDSLPLAAALAEPGWVGVSRRLAERQGWCVGDRLRVVRGTRTATLVVGATVDFDRSDPGASARLALMDIAQVQSLFGGAGRLTEIAVVLDERADADAVAAALGRLGPAVRVQTPGDRVQQAGELLAAFRLNLTALSLVSLVVGAFLVYASLQASLVRRRREFGILRATGASQRQVVGLIGLEVLELASVGVALGIPLGWLAARLQLDAVSGTLRNVYLLESIEKLTLPPSIWALGLATGLVGAAGGALLPTLDIVRRPPRALLAAATWDSGAIRIAARLAYAAAVLVAFAFPIALAVSDRWRPAGFALALTLLVALPLATPWAMREIARRIPVRGFGVGYSLRTLAARLRSTSVATSALAAAVALLVGITITVASFRQTLDDWIVSAVQADVYVTAASWIGAGEGELDPDLVRRLGARPGVASIDRLHLTRAWIGDRRVRLIGVDMAVPGGRSRFPLMRGDPDAAFGAAATGAALVSEPLARGLALGVGDRVTVAGPAGPVTLPVAGVYAEYDATGGTVAIDRTTLQARFGLDAVHSVALYVEPGVDAEAFRDRLAIDLEALPLSIRSNRALRTRALELFDQTFAVTTLLKTMALAIAGFGVALTLLVLAREERPELALYLSLGARRGQLFGHFVGKGVAIGLVALTLGALVGVALAAILIHLVNPAYFGWTIRPTLPVGELAIEALLILAAATIAALYPAARATRAPVTDLDRDDA